MTLAFEWSSTGRRVVVVVVVVVVEGRATGPLGSGSLVFSLRKIDT